MIWKLNGKLWHLLVCECHHGLTTTVDPVSQHTTLSKSCFNCASSWCNKLFWTYILIDNLTFLNNQVLVTVCLPAEFPCTFSCISWHGSWPLYFCKGKRIYQLQKALIEKYFANVFLFFCLLSSICNQMLWTIFVQLLLILYFVQVKPQKHNQKLAYTWKNRHKYIWTHFCISDCGRVEIHEGGGTYDAST